MLFVLCYFNPRSHERSDLCSFDFITLFFISIHAPTRGATKGYEFCTNSYSISIHAPTRGATFNLFSHCQIFLFQSTLPREERHHASISLSSCGDYFNPRSHERSDDLSVPLSVLLPISIHAPTRGATQT